MLEMLVHIREVSFLIILSDIPSKISTLFLSFYLLDLVLLVVQGAFPTMLQCIRRSNSSKLSRWKFPDNVLTFNEQIFNYFSEGTAQHVFVHWKLDLLVTMIQEENLLFRYHFWGNYLISRPKVFFYGVI